MTRIGRFAALAFALVLTGCGDPLLWARWRAERATWQADREVMRIFVNPRVARPEDFHRAEVAYRAVTRAFPGEEWVSRTEPRAREVAEISGGSTLALARLAELQGRTDEALGGYAQVASDWSGYPRLRLEALDHLGSALEESGRTDDAMLVWETEAREFEPWDAARGELRDAVLESPLRLARVWTDRGQIARRDSTLAGAESRLETSVTEVRDHAAQATLLDAIAQGRRARGDVPGALDAWRRTLAIPGPDSTRARRVLRLGERQLEAGRADSSVIYARWAASLGGPARLPALELQARAFQAASRPDSALGAYGAVMTEFAHDADAAAEARYQRAMVLEQLDRWAQARSELGSLCASQPTHPRALEAWTHVVDHYQKLGEKELARIEADHGVSALDLLISTQHDAELRLRCTEALASVQLADHRVLDASTTLRGLWAAAPVTPEGAALGAATARAAEKELRDAALARGLWQILSERSPDPAVRREAEAALGRPAS